jgi:hypothetical protein
VYILLREVVEMVKETQVLVLAAVVTTALLGGFYLYPLYLGDDEVSELAFVRTGGFIGLNEMLIVRSDGSVEYTSNHFGNVDFTLNVTEVEDLFDKAKLLESDTKYTVKSGVADFFTYSLTAITGSGNITLGWVDDWAMDETVSSEVGEIQLHIESIVVRARNLVSEPTDPQERAIDIAWDFIVESPTFRFDGLLDTLKIVDAVTLESFPEQHIITLTYDSTHAGYGDREGQMLAQVITTHTAKIKVVSENVVSAILDDTWDVLKQETRPDPNILDPNEVRDLVMRFIEEMHSEAAQFISDIIWSGGRVTQEGLVGHETYVYEGADWNVTIDWNVVAPEHLVYKVVATHASGILWVGEVVNGEVTEHSYDVDQGVEGALSVADLLMNPVYDRDVRIYGEIRLLGELFCPCFELVSGGEKVEVWYDLMVEDDGEERPSVSMALFENGDWVILRGELKSEGENRKLNDFWVKEIVPSTSNGTYLSEETSLEIALEFVKNSPTFLYDGMEDSLIHEETLYPRCPYCWQFIFSFDSRNGGYGDREGQAVDTVITPHRAVISVVKGRIVSAILDEKWDILTQQEVQNGNQMSTISGRVSIGPMCPVEPCPDPNPDLYSSREILLQQIGLNYVIRVQLSDDGRFEASVGAGRYSPKHSNRYGYPGRHRY